MWRVLRKIAIVTFVLFVLAFIGIQFVPVDRSNPPITTDIPAPADVKQVLRNSCYDCHSNETVWPWYSKVAPVSWYISDDVRVGRGHLNFSNWDLLSERKKSHTMEEITDGGMPLPNYVKMHPEAKLSTADLKLLEDWASAPQAGEN